MTLKTEYQVSVSLTAWRPLPGDLAPATVDTYETRAVLSIAKSDPQQAYTCARSMLGEDGDIAALAAGDGALLLGLPDLARQAYKLAARHPFTNSLVAACARYGLALVAYGLGAPWAALQEIDKALALLRGQDSGLVAVLEDLGDTCLTRLAMGER